MSNDWLRADMNHDDPGSQGYSPPPDGWFEFGTHVDQDVDLEFSAEVDETGLPRWERTR